MRIRGNVFWKWADPTLHHRSHDETLTMDIQVRLSRTGVTQLFIGVYAGTGWCCMRRRFSHVQVSR